MDSRRFKETCPDVSTRTGDRTTNLKADQLDYIMYRMGLLAGLRAQDTSAAIGVMITASHNPEQDNGIKLVDPMGEMLAPAWEAHATTLVNAPDDGVAGVLEKIVSEACIDTNKKALVFVGRDTRPSSNRLRDAVIAGVTAIGGEVKDFGIISTPILHYVVTCYNDGENYGKATVKGYYQKIAQAFVKLRSSSSSHGNYDPVILFDGANGVGALAMTEFLNHLQDSLRVTIFNKGEGVLNHMCGADYVKVQQKWPEGVPKTQNVRCVSIDGDGDRVIYSVLDSEGRFHMLDGDKIATLVADYLQELVKSSGLKLKLGLVQTAYANGASTAYITKQLGIPVACARTGVKHLHRMAQQFDIGVYFEANGHGTVIFSTVAREAIQAAAKAKEGHAEKLSQVLDVINETVGDAISDMLLVESILHARGWSVLDWNEAYTDFPNRQMTVTVADRAVITTTDAERECVTPEGLQDAINKIVSAFSKGRSFVRPSGTEDIVRIYAEASTQEEADNLAIQVACAVYELAGGIGDRPKASMLL
ncbi:phosphoacetylglucosamine mutase isoform X2 [Cherax quadricarinatus]|uniref:phosphoacetylglucosamine mutase isoform X2 n=1 Tax=Cherax quadricarinatus TaxID=27406 RepID=UPI0023795A41|nr:phosphoacetylglucosamine mutase-like isoform X2 [Cherax quadricarinatus]